MSFKNDLIDDMILTLTAAMDIAIEQTQKELTAQGHVLTGRLRDNITQEIEIIGSSIMVHMLLEDYFEPIEKGVAASNIPFGSGGGTTSDYIQGLIRSFEQRGLTSKDAKRAAFATANKHRMEGMPTRASFRFSRNGRRTGFLTQAFKDADDKINAVLQTIIDLFNERLLGEIDAH